MCLKETRLRAQTLLTILASIVNEGAYMNKVNGTNLIENCSMIIEHVIHVLTWMLETETRLRYEPKMGTHR